MTVVPQNQGGCREDSIIIGAMTRNKERCGFSRSACIIIIISKSGGGASDFAKAWWEFFQHVVGYGRGWIWVWMDMGVDGYGCRVRSRGLARNASSARRCLLKCSVDL